MSNSVMQFGDELPQLDIGNDTFPVNLNSSEEYSAATASLARMLPSVSV